MPPPGRSRSSSSSIIYCSYTDLFLLFYEYPLLNLLHILPAWLGTAVEQDLQNRLEGPSITQWYIHMIVKSFHLNGLLFEIHTTKLPENHLNVSFLLDGKEIEDSGLKVRQAELDKYVNRVEQAIRNDLAV